MARRVARARFVRPPPRTKMWIGAHLGLISITASADAVVGSYNAAALALRPFTILRTRMELLFDSDQQAANEDPQGSFGMIIANATAVALGTTAIPSPAVAFNSDWHVYQDCQTRFTFLSTIGAIDPAGQRYTIDSKAMRKVGPNDDQAWVFAEDGGHGAFLYIRGRQLIQLH